MNFILYIARRYLLAKKSTNAINVISGISVIGVAVGAMALIVVLSVFNGFDKVLKDLFNTFDPDIKITATLGKTFPYTDSLKNTLETLDGIAHVAAVIEENAMLRYDDKQYVATIKGVCPEYEQVTGIDTMIVDGEFSLKKNNKPYAVVGQGVAYYLSIGLNFVDAINIYVPRRDYSYSLIPEKAFKRNYVHPSGIFSIQQEFDQKYILLPIDYVRDLLDYENEATALEIKVAKPYTVKGVKKTIAENLGDSFKVKDRFEQKELFFKIMKSEKLAIYLILTFILAVASFNIIGSLTMLIIEKKEDIFTLRSMGADEKMIKKIFFTEGWLISLSGAVIGVFLGLGIAWAQIQFGFLKLQGSGAFIIDAYPVDIKVADIFLVLAIVILIGMIAAYIPAAYLTRKFFKG